MKVAFQGILYKLERYMCRTGDIEGKMTFKIAPIDDTAWDEVSRLHKPEKTVMLVVMDEGETGKI